MFSSTSSFTSISVEIHKIQQIWYFECTILLDFCQRRWTWMNNWPRNKTKKKTVQMRKWCIECRTKTEHRMKMFPLFIVLFYVYCVNSTWSWSAASEFVSVVTINRSCVKWSYELFAMVFNLPHFGYFLRIFCWFFIECHLVHSFRQTMTNENPQNTVLLTEITLKPFSFAFLRVHLRDIISNKYWSVNNLKIGLHSLT